MALPLSLQDATADSFGDGVVTTRRNIQFTVPPGPDATGSQIQLSGSYRLRVFDTNGKEIPIIPGNKIQTPPGKTSPVQLTMLNQIIPMYLYDQWSGIKFLELTVQVFNELAQEYLTKFLEFALFDYTNVNLTEGELRYILLAVYGFDHFNVSYQNINSWLAGLNQFYLNEKPVGEVEVNTQLNTTSFTTDIAKRIVAWNIYRGDGQVMNVQWLKKRIKRFILSAQGDPAIVTDTSDISVTYSNRLIQVTVPFIDQQAQYALNEAANSGLLQLPIGYSLQLQSGDV